MCDFHLTNHKRKISCERKMSVLSSHGVYYKRYDILQFKVVL